MGDTSLNAASACAGPHNTSRPNVAFCIAGAARTFATPLIQDGIRANFFGQLSGGGHDRFFILIKTDDSTKIGMSGSTQMANDRFVQHHSDPEELLIVLNNSWITPMLAAAVVVQGSGAHVWGAPTQTISATVALAVANASLWQLERAEFCPNASRAERFRRSDETCCEPIGPFRDEQAVRGNEARLVHQHLNLRWCYMAIIHQERVQGWQFDLVAFSRPDLFWYGYVAALDRTLSLYVFVAGLRSFRTGHAQTRPTVVPVAVAYTHAFVLLSGLRYDVGRATCPCRPSDGPGFAPAQLPHKDSEYQV